MMHPTPVTRRIRSLWLAAALLLAPLAFAASAAPRVLPEGKVPNDKRLAPLKTLNGYFPFQPPATRGEWDKRAERVRRQMLVSQGLWPMPQATPANAVIHGRVDRPDYTVDRVYLESYPGHFVTGSLYRPKGKSGRLPGVLCPHGHWAEGRFHDAGLKAVRQEIVQGAERFEAGGRSPLQSRCVQLCRMGCAVFHYDMVGYADSQQIPFEVSHRYARRRANMESSESWGFFSPQAELQLQNIMGLQTYNSVRALDWLVTLPDVDPARIAVTGASGGGTQTFMLCGIDSRPAVAFPAVMVSTGMQGGCTCENAPYLRIDTGNVEFAGLFAPKPLGMTGANDWTVEIAAKGLPELKQLYTLLGAPDHVMARPLNHFGHNYNYVSRAAMYSWFNKHLNLGLEEPVVEEDYQPLSVAEMTVWDDAHPRPPSGEEYERLFTRQMAEASARQLAALAPRDAASLAEYRRVVGGALEAMIGHGLPAAAEIEYERVAEQDRGGYTEYTALVRNKEHGSELPAVFLHPKNWNKQVVLWIDEAGKAGLFGSDGSPRPEVRKLVDGGATVAGVDLLYQGEFNADGQPPKKARRVDKDREFAGYTVGYNHPLFAERVEDVLTLVTFIKNHQDKPERIHLVALNGAGPWGAAAVALAGEAIERAALDTAGFRFAKLTEFDDVNFLPGAVKYGDLPGLVSLAAPHALWLAGEGAEPPATVRAAYQAAGKGDAIATYGGAESGEAAAAAAWIGQ
ncbi:MAG: acetylxylan esterase [Planctomycetia bacterium]|nr:acetylxylan esterase [Planctomycetia bacterium]